MAGESPSWRGDSGKYPPSIAAASVSGAVIRRTVVRLAEGTTQTVIVQRRGALLSVILGEARLFVFDVARKIFHRMAALTPAAAGDA